MIHVHSFVHAPFCSVSLIGVEGGNATRISRFANYLRNLLPSSDPVVMEMASKAMGHLSMAGDTFTAEYVEFEVKRALEWLGADRNEGRRHAAVGEIYGIDPALNDSLMLFVLVHEVRGAIQCLVAHYGARGERKNPPE